MPAGTRLTRCANPGRARKIGGGPHEDPRHRQAGYGLRTEGEDLADGLSLVTEGMNFVPNPFDEIAVEEALRLQKAHGGEVVVISIGHKDASKEIRRPWPWARIAAST
jgi:hypothetical protein